MRLSPAPGSDPRGVTLMEVLIIVIVVAILAGLAIPQLSRMIERGHRRAAIDILTTIYSGERAYYFTKSPVDARQYYGPPLTKTSSNDQWGEIFMDNPNMGSGPVNFVVSAAPPATGVSATFTGTASYNGKKMSVSNSNEETVWCGTSGAKAPTNMDPDSCSGTAWWPIP